MIAPELDLKIDTKIKLFYQKGNPNNILYHVRGFVDDQVIVRYWIKGRWRYEMLNPSWFIVNSKYEGFSIIR